MPQRQTLMIIFVASWLLATLAVFAVGFVFATPLPVTVTVGPVQNFPLADTPYLVEVGEFKAWIVNTGDDLIILDPFISYKDRRGCDYLWVPSNGRFEAPCCVGKWSLEGLWIDGPTHLDLNRYAYEIIDGEIIVYLGCVDI